MKAVKDMSRTEIVRELELYYGVACYDDDDFRDLVECLKECRGEQ